MPLTTGAISPPEPFIGIPGQNLTANYGNMGARNIWGPFEWNGFGYMVLEEEDDSTALLPKNLRVYRTTPATAQSGNWTELDTANRPSYARAGTCGIDADLPVLYIGYGHQTSFNASMFLAFTTFDLSTETWGTKTVSALGMESTGASTDSLGVIHRSNGNIYFVYDRKVVGLRRVVYSRWNGATFDVSEQIVDDGGFPSGFGAEPVAVVDGSADRIHIFYADYGRQNQGAAPYVYHKVLDASDVLSAQTTVATITLYTPAEVLAEHPVVSYDDFIMYHTGAPGLWQSSIVFPYVTGKKLYVATATEATPTVWTERLVEGVIRPADAWHENSIAVAGPAPSNKLYVFWNSWYKDAGGGPTDPGYQNMLYVSKSPDAITWQTAALYNSLDFPQDLSGNEFPIHNIQAQYLPAFGVFLIVFDQYLCSTSFPGQEVDEEVSAYRPTVVFGSSAGLRIKDAQGYVGFG